MIGRNYNKDFPLQLQGWPHTNYLWKNTLNAITQIFQDKGR